jgi:hypothetical protein
MIRISLFSLVLGFGVVLSNCNGTPSQNIVTINYEQVGACNGFNNGSGVTSAGPKAAYVIFRISSIANKESAAQDFNFDPNRLFVSGTSPQVFASTHLNLAQINPFAVTSRFVGKGTTETLNGAATCPTPSLTTLRAADRGCCW